MQDLGIPAGRDAIDQWKALPREVRDGVLGFAAAQQPYPLPEIARIAAGWSRVAQRRRPIRRLRAFALTALAGCAAMPLLALHTGTPDGLEAVLAWCLAAALVVLAAFAQSGSPIGTAPGGATLGLVAALNGTSTLAAALRERGTPARPGQPVTVGYAGAIPGTYLAFVASVLPPVVWWLAVDHVLWHVFPLALVVQRPLVMAVRAARNGYRLRHGILVLSDHGAAIPGLGIAAPWTDIAVVDYDCRLQSGRIFLMLGVIDAAARRALAAQPALSEQTRQAVWSSSAFGVELPMIAGDPDAVALAAYAFGGPDLVARALPALEAVDTRRPGTRSQQVASQGSEGS